MKTEAVNAFWHLVAKDAGVQARIVEAAKQPDALLAVATVAQSAGFDFTAEEFEDTLTSELTDEELDAVAGGNGTNALLATTMRRQFSHHEFFAEIHT